MWESRTSVDVGDLGAEAERHNMDGLDSGGICGQGRSAGLLRCEWLQSSGTMTCILSYETLVPGRSRRNGH